MLIWLWELYDYDYAGRSSKLFPQVSGQLIDYNDEV